MLNSNATEEKERMFLSEAISMESCMSEWLDELFERFSCFDKRLSLTLKEKGFQCLQHKQRLLKLHEQRFGRSDVDTTCCRLTYWHQNRFFGENHFFVINENMAEELLIKIWMMEKRICEFYRQIGTQTLFPLLAQAYLQLATEHQEMDHPEKKEGSKIRILTRLARAHFTMMVPS